MRQIVHTGVAGRLDWRVETTGDTTDMYTSIVFVDNGKIIGERGFGGPPLYPGSVTNSYCGVGDRTPYAVLVRTAPEVDRIVVDWTIRGSVAAALSDVLDPYGVRIAVAVGTGSDEPAAIHAFTGDQEIDLP